MPRGLAIALSVTDIAFLLYWILWALALLGVVHVPQAWLYADAKTPRVVAWTASFLPLDLAFSVCGLSAVAAARRGDPIWRPLALLSLAFTMTAGGMAVAYWALLGEFNPAWLLPNLALLIWPAPFLWRLVREQGRAGLSGS